MHIRLRMETLFWGNSSIFKIAESSSYIDEKK